MKVYWKALVCYGLIFWIVLCIMDRLSITSGNKLNKEFTIEEQELNKPRESTHQWSVPSVLRKSKYQRLQFGWNFTVWIILTFLLSVMVCSFGQAVAWKCWSVYKSQRNKLLHPRLNPKRFNRKVGSLSKIPVVAKSMARYSSSNLEPKTKIEAEKSCPNLSMKRTSSSLSNSTDLTVKTCRTLFRKDIYLSDNPELSKEQKLEKQCTRLKEELHRLQTTSLKEHAILSRKLDTITQTKRDIEKQLCLVQKENRAAKQQLEEVLQEKTALLKKLENATKEFRANTKTKKYALARLEEVTNDVEELRQQLEQVTRDKEILEKKLRLLETEYNKLHERYIMTQRQLHISACTNENIPERDETHEKSKNSECVPDKDVSSPVIQTAEVLASVSQTELDMKKIQEKIKQLEKNLENLNLHDNQFGFTGSLCQLESEISLSGTGNTTDSQHRMDEEPGTTFSELSNGNSPRYKYWSERVADLIGRNKHQFAKIQALATKVQKKAHRLGNINEKPGSTEDTITTDSDEREPRRLVSSSVAFKNFLKSLNQLDAAKRELPSKPEVYF